MAWALTWHTHGCRLTSAPHRRAHNRSLQPPCTYGHTSAHRQRHPPPKQCSVQLVGADDLCRTETSRCHLAMRHLHALRAVHPRTSRTHVALSPKHPEQRSACDTCPQQHDSAVPSAPPPLPAPACEHASDAGRERRGTWRACTGTRCVGHGARALRHPSRGIPSSPRAPWAWPGRWSVSSSPS